MAVVVVIMTGGGGGGGYSGACHDCVKVTGGW